MEPRQREQGITWGQVSGELESGERVTDWRRPSSIWAKFLEKTAVAVEKPVNSLIQSHRLNPFYHTGTIAIFLLIIIGLTGFYLFLFYQYGVKLSYQSVVQMEAQFIARTMRAIHRYASGAAVVTTLLHALRALFKEQFRGPRWLAWVMGVGLTAVIWLGGVTGYWLLWDERAGVIMQRLLNPLGATAVTTMLTAVRGVSWPWVLGLMGVHILLFVIAIGFFVLHVWRLNRAKWLPSMPWVVGMGLVLLVGGVAFPLGLLPPLDLNHLPAAVPLDLLYLFYLPFSAEIAVFLWVGVLVATVGFTAIPWLLPGRKTAPPRVRILEDRCTGCTLCAVDCPYGAIEMVARQDGKRHKYVAVAQPEYCVSCGICVGSCDDVAVTLGEAPPEALWGAVAGKLATAPARAKLVFTCERHAGLGARPYLDADDYVVVPVPCVGTLPPDLLARAVGDDQREVQVIGCPPDDCNFREGNAWLAQRLTRERLPRLQRADADKPLWASWVAPNEFGEAIQTKPETIENYQRSRWIDWPFSWRNVTVAFGLLGLALALQIWLTDVSLPVNRAETAVLQLALPDPSQPMGKPIQLFGEVEFHLFVDDARVFGRLVDMENPGLVQTAVSLPPGEHDVRLIMDAGDQIELFADTITLSPREVYWLGIDRELRRGTNLQR